jgi:hypothetical protein
VRPPTEARRYGAHHRETIILTVDFDNDILAARLRSPIG